MSLKFYLLKFQFSFPLLVAFWWINQQVECWSVLGEGGEVLLKFNFVQTLSAAVWGRRETNNKFYRSSTDGLAFYLQDANFAIFFFFESHLHDCIFSHFLLIFRCDLRDEVLRDALRPEGRWRFVRRWHNDCAEMERWMTRCYFTHFRLTRKRDTGGEKPPWISLKAKRTDMFRCWLSEDKFNVWEMFHFGTTRSIWSLFDFLMELNSSAMSIDISSPQRWSLKCANDSDEKHCQTIERNTVTRLRKILTNNWEKYCKKIERNIVKQLREIL